MAIISFTLIMHGAICTRIHWIVHRRRSISISGLSSKSIASSITSVRAPKQTRLCLTVLADTWFEWTLHRAKKSIEMCVEMTSVLRTTLGRMPHDACHRHDPIRTKVHQVKCRLINRTQRLIPMRASRGCDVESNHMNVLCKWVWAACETVHCVEAYGRDVNTD